MAKLPTRKGKPTVGLRLPPAPVPPPDADAFVRGERPAAQTSRHPDVWTPERPTLQNRAEPAPVEPPASAAPPSKAPSVNPAERPDVQVPGPPDTRPEPDSGALTVRASEPPDAQTSGPVETPHVVAPPPLPPLPPVPSVPADRSPERLDVQTSGSSEVPAAPRAPLLPVASSAGRGVVVRADGTERRRTTVYLPPSLARRLTVYCAGEGLEMSEVTAAALEAWLGARGA